MVQDRRKALALLGGGLAAAGIMGPALIRGTSRFGAKGPSDDVGGDGPMFQQPLPYAKVDPVRVGELGYSNFYRGDCMYGVFASIVEALAEEVGEPFTSFPTWVTRYGAGGVMGWGTLCGAANGAAMAIYLVSKDPVPAIDRVFAFYEQEMLPNYLPGSAEQRMMSSQAGSMICHVSVAKWCEVSGFKAFSPERLERCAQLAASVAKYTAEVLNAQVDGSLEPDRAVSASTSVCLACHGQAGVLRDARGRMFCEGCHSVRMENHG